MRIQSNLPISQPGAQGTRARPRAKQNDAADTAELSISRPEKSEKPDESLALKAFGAVKTSPKSFLSAQANLSANRVFTLLNQ